MPTPSGHTRAIRASKVQGTSVYNTQGESLGTVEDVILDKTSNNIMFAVVGFGGVLGMGEKFHPVPWSLLDYDDAKGGYVVPLTKDVLKTAPAYDINDLTKHDGEIRDKAYSFYKVDRDW
jgi:sporulation protein YlmC with PRC-barrel domain